LTKGDEDAETSEWVSPLDPKKSVHICTFSPCIEQVTRTIEELRLLGWTDIDMVEISARRINTVRERVGANLPAERGNVQTPADVKEAMTRLKEINRKTKEFHKVHVKSTNGDDDSSAMDVDTPASNSSKPNTNGKDVEDDSKPWMGGRLYHRPETDLKTHTSYLTFAILPREWTEEDEAAAWAKWPCGKEGGVIGSLNRQARKQQTREKLAANKNKKQKQENDTQREGEAEVAAEMQ
jgi:tRNA (adenine57-N1/adenine58-N1)-methyltransferase